MKFIRSKIKTLVLAFMGTYGVFALTLSLTQNPNNPNFKGELNAPFIFAPFERIVWGASPNPTLESGLNDTPDAALSAVEAAKKAVNQGVSGEQAISVGSQSFKAKDPMSSDGQ